MQNILLSFIILFSFTACDEDEKQAKKQAAIHKAIKAEKDALLIELKAKDEALQKARLETKIAKEKLLKEEVSKKEAFLKIQKEKEANQKQAKKNENLSKVGITIKKNTITLDTNKTKNFFDSLGKKLGERLKKITQELEEGMVDEKEAGVHIDETHINIDFNKTKDFIKNWGKKMQGFVQDFDNMAKEMDRERKPLEDNQKKGN